MATKRKRINLRGKQKGVETVFIIMPFGGSFDLYYDQIYKKAIRKASLNPCRLDDSHSPVVLVKEMYENTKSAKIILADLTENKPNVCYELGLAHASNKPTILVSDSIDNIPFDVNAFRVIIYDKNDPNWGEKLKQNIWSALDEIIKNPQKFQPLKLLATEAESESVDKLDELTRLRLMSGELTSLSPSLSPSVNLHRRHSIIRPDEAVVLLQHYLRLRKSRRYIIDKLVSLGAPRGWVLGRISGRRMLISRK